MVSRETEMVTMKAIEARGSLSRDSFPVAGAVVVSKPREGQGFIMRTFGRADDAILYAQALTGYEHKIRYSKAGKQKEDIILSLE